MTKKLTEGAAHRQWIKDERKADRARFKAIKQQTKGSKKASSRIKVGLLD